MDGRTEPHWDRVFAEGPPKEAKPKPKSPKLKEKAEKVAKVEKPKAKAKSKGLLQGALQRSALVGGRCRPPCSQGSARGLRRPGRQFPLDSLSQSCRGFRFRWSPRANLRGHSSSRQLFRAGRGFWCSSFAGRGPLQRAPEPAAA